MSGNPAQIASEMLLAKRLGDGEIRAVAKAVLAWYFLREVKGRTTRIPKPNPRSRMQQAALQEAEVYFDRLLDEGAWTAAMAYRLTRYTEHDGSIELQDGWVKTKNRVTGINMSAAKIVACALNGGKGYGENKNGVPAAMIVPPWRVSRQLCRIVVEESRAAVPPWVWAKGRS